MSIFDKQENHHSFSWDKLGDIEEGRGDLGTDMPVLVYRMMQYTMLDVLTRAYGEEQANEHFRAAGHLAGMEYAKNTLDTSADADAFLAQLQNSLKELKVGVLRVERFDAESGDFTLTVGQDLDCSGLPVSDEMVCNYDEGFIAGILEAYTHKPYHVREVDCWAAGDRVCRFEGKVSGA